MNYGSKTLESLADIRAACQHAVALAPLAYPPDLPSKPELLGAPDWYPFEHTPCALGEEIRQAFKRTSGLKHNSAVLESIADVVDTINLRRGRQSFVMALGFKAAAGLAQRIAAHLSDRDVAGQCVDTLLKMRAPGFAAEVALLRDDDQTWVRRLARKYIERYAAA